MDCKLMKRLIVALTLLSFLSACGAVRDSRLNPFNWFGRDREERVQAVEIQGPVETRPLVAQVISLKVDRMPGGAIIYAVWLYTSSQAAVTELELRSAPSGASISRS